MIVACAICQEIFNSVKKLKEHKQDEGHFGSQS